jgi:hypothetical protein
MKTMNFKRVLISFVTVGSFFVSTAFAQETPKQERQRPSAEERAQKQTDRMKEKLNLSDEQSKSVYDINLKYAKSDEIEFKKDQEAREKRMEAMKASHEKKDADLKNVLSADQYDKYQQQKKEAKRKMDKKMKNKHHKGKKCPPPAPEKK